MILTEVKEADQHGWPGLDIFKKTQKSVLLKLFAQTNVADILLSTT
jgi:hypothetical protein